MYRSNDEFISFYAGDKIIGQLSHNSKMLNAKNILFVIYFESFCVLNSRNFMIKAFKTF